LSGRSVSSLMFSFESCTAGVLDVVRQPERYLLEFHSVRKIMKLSEIVEGL
jgi:hypothetical protein